MTQIATNRYHYRMLPGLMMQASNYETESVCAPHTLQSFTFTIAGGTPAAAGLYTAAFVTPASGTLTVSYTSPGEAYAAFVANFAAAGNATIGLGGNMFMFTSDGAAVVTATARSANLDLAVPTTTVPGADTLTAAEATAPGAPSLRMGLFYVYGTGTQGAVTNTPRQARPAALPSSATLLADLRGVIGRPANQTQLSPDFNDAVSFDQFRAGQVMPGVLRDEVAVVVDPASGTMDIDSEVYVVIASGVYSTIGAVADAADGANTIRIDNSPTGNILGRVTAIEETLTLGTQSVRLVMLKVNRTN